MLGVEDFTLDRANLQVQVVFEEGKVSSGLDSSLAISEPCFKDFSFRALLL